MIIRIFKAIVPLEKHLEFEQKFREISVPLVQHSQGLLSVEIGKPGAVNPDEFVMISIWDKVESLIKFAGDQWNVPHIPKGMEVFIAECSVAHYESIAL